MRSPIPLTSPLACGLVAALLASLGLAACGQDEAHLTNRLDLAVGIEVRAPRASLRGGCQQDFRQRFCDDEYEVIGVLDVSPLEDRTIAISDAVSDTECTNVLWMRLVRLGDVGPVDDRGTLLELPTDVEIEEGAGAIHTVAFPQATVRIDEVGLGDQHQGPPPPTCAALGR